MLLVYVDDTRGMFLLSQENLVLETDINGGHVRKIYTQKDEDKLN